MYEAHLRLGIPLLSLQAGSPLSHTRERRRAKRSGGKESAEGADFALAATPRTLVLQGGPSRGLPTHVMLARLQGCLKQDSLRFRSDVF